MAQKNQLHGFRLLVVIAIIAILAAMLLSALRKLFEQAAAGKIVIDVPTEQSASLVMPDASVRQLEEGVNDIEFSAANP